MKFEAFESETGQFHWRLRDASGQIVPLRRGKVMTPPTSAKEGRRARAAVSRTLSQLVSAAVRAKA